MDDPVGRPLAFEFWALNPTQERQFFDPRLQAMLNELLTELERRVGKHGTGDLPDGVHFGWETAQLAANWYHEQSERAKNCANLTWLHIAEHTMADLRASDDEQQLQLRLIELAAICVSWSLSVRGRAVESQR